MKYLMYSECGEGAGVLKRIELEGNKVELYIHDPIYKDVYDGILPKTKAPNPDSDTVIIFDMSGNGVVAEKWIKCGYKVIGASSLMDELEHDREYGFKVMQDSGILIPETKKFKSFKDGISYAKDFKGRLVFKPNGSMPCKLTFVSKDNEELVEYLSFVESRFKKDIDDFILQEFIEGCVVSSELWFDGTKVLYPGNHTVEVKKFMDKELGPSTGCSGNTTWLCDSDVLTQGISKIEKFCVDNCYIGPIDLNTVVNDTGVYGLEWTPRWGYDATPTLLSLLEIDYGKFFSDLVDGKLEEMPIKPYYASAVRLTVPPYPAELKRGLDPEKFSPNEGIPILNWEKYQEDMFFYEVRLEDEKLVHSSGTGVLALTLGHDEDCKKSFKKPYEILDKLHVPDMQYRTDLDTVIPKMIKEIEEYA